LSTLLAYQNRAEVKDSLDDYPTPPWATRALCRFLVDEGFNLGEMKCVEPAANRGLMVRALQEFFEVVEGSDIHDYGAGFPVVDFLGEHKMRGHFTITNPPYTKATEFALRMLFTSYEGCAMLVRTAFLEGAKRHQELYAKHPPAYILQFTERVAMRKGGAYRSIPSAVPYAWVVWIKDQKDTRLRWIEPCRRQLEKDEDYA
jgi:hypothetical protein